MSVIEEKLTIPTADGAANAYAAYPEGSGPWPVVLLYMDALGVRQTLREMAQRLAAGGRFVLLPNLFYREGPCEDMDFTKDQKRFMGFLKGLRIHMVMRDVEAYLAFLQPRRNVSTDRFGAVGYCMGGRMALATAGHFGERVKAVAAIHAGAVATDSEESPHKLAAQMRAKLYVGVAGSDAFLQPGEIGRLQAALDEGDVDYTLETYPDVQHGFAVPDLPMYDRPAAERHWERVTALFDQTLRPA